MGHDGNVTTTLLAGSSQELNEFISIGISCETLRPERQTTGSDTEVLDVWKEVRITEWLEGLSKRLGSHDHWVTSSHKDIRDFFMLGKVVEKGTSFFLCKAKLIISDELSPTEAVCAVSVACLGSSRENENGLAVFVLDTGELIFLRGVELLLAGWVGVEVLTDLSNNLDETSGVSNFVGGLELLSVFRNKHVQGREDELVERIFLYIASLPVDQFINVVWRSLEWKDHTGKFNIVKVLLQLRVVLSNLVESLKTNGLVSFIRLIISNSVGADNIVQAVNGNGVGHLRIGRSNFDGFLSLGVQSGRDCIFIKESGVREKNVLSKRKR
mmetsp:Transcript_32250/g.53305  ORF Transcript_32250/g.53305 Transcript_32250/m.53305 type:complete len:327 (+) Transcript_32250:950-1930(+)